MLMGNHGLYRNGATFGQLWTPAQLTTALWLDAADASTITLNGSTVSQWRDKSSNNRHADQTTAAIQPAYTTAGLNGLNTVSPNGSTTYLTFADKDFARNMNAISYFAIIRRTSGSATDGNIIGWSAGSSIFARANLYIGSGGLRPGGRRLDANPFQSMGLNYTVANTSLVAAIFDYANAQLYCGLNGQTNYTARFNGFQTEGSTSNTASVFAGIGWDGYPGNWFGGDIGEIVAFQSVLSLPDRQKLEGYLAWKWGLTANLPANHPFKNSRPTV